MDFRRPFLAVAPTLDGDVLAVLATADVELSGRQLAGRAGHGSTEGIRRAADRLVTEGVVLRRAAGGANLYRLNRDHVAARWIEGIATMPEQVIETLRSGVAEWEERASFVFLFGSAARREASAGSDIDVLVVRGGAGSQPPEVWRSQLVELQRSVTAMTGNDTRILEVSEGELGGDRIRAVLDDVVRDGISLEGSRRSLMKRIEEG